MARWSPSIPSLAGTRPVRRRRQRRGPAIRALISPPDVPVVPSPWKEGGRPDHFRTEPQIVALNVALAPSRFHHAGGPSLRKLPRLPRSSLMRRVRSDMAVEFGCRLDRRQAAAFLTARGYRTAPATLAKLACVGGGPMLESFCRNALYREADLLGWATAETTGPRAA